MSLMSGGMAFSVRRFPGGSQMIADPEQRERLFSVPGAQARSVLLK